MSFFKTNKGSGYLIVIALAGIMAIFLVALGRFRQGVFALFSKSAQDFLATTVAEAGLNCALGELRFNSSFCTHRNYLKNKNPPWEKPNRKNEPVVGNIKDLYVNGVENGVYSGGTNLGTFKLHCATIFGNKDNAKTKTLDEKEMYKQIEVVSHVGDGKKNENNSYRKITALVEARLVAAEHLLFDAEMLDMGMGTYDKEANILDIGRLYGYQGIFFNTFGGGDCGTNLTGMEKIETPGILRAFRDTKVTFSNMKTASINSSNDSMNYAKFSSYDGYILDGAHGAHPMKVPFQQEHIFEKAKHSPNSGGLIIDKGAFPESKWKNPYNPSDQYVDLDFGEFHCQYITSSQIHNESVDDTYGQLDYDEDVDNSGSPQNGDDPGPIGKLRGQRLLIYSKVPLRIWGCPDRTITIFSEQDIVVAGDFNQNSTTKQCYKTDSYQDYLAQVECGKDKGKVSALLISKGRILIDMSNPYLFLKNEMKPFFLYMMCKNLQPENQGIDDEARNALCPADPTKPQLLLMVGSRGSDGLYTSRFRTILWLTQHADFQDWDGPSGQIAYEDIKNFFTPGGAGKPCFGIRDATVRKSIIDLLNNSCKTNGWYLTIDAQKKIFDMAWNQALKEDLENPGLDCGARSLINALFDEAIKKSDDGIFVPEITINAALVSAVRRSSKWVIGQSDVKSFDELGNSPTSPGGEYLKKPRFLIQRIYGSDIRLATEEPKYFISGKYAPTSILRRRIWDRTPLSTNYTFFKPLQSPKACNILTFREETITKDDFDKF